MLVKPPIINLKKTARADGAVSACSPLLQSITGLAPLDARGKRLIFGHMFTHAHHQLAASEINQTSLCTNLAWLFAFEQQAARQHIPFSNSSVCILFFCVL